MSVIIISPEAWKKVHEKLNQSGHKNLRISLNIRGCNGHEYVYEPTDEDPTETDNIVEDGSHKVLIAPKDELFLIGSTLNWIQDTFVSRFDFENPSVTGSCGCGESVSFD